MKNLVIQLAVILIAGLAIFKMLNKIEQLQKENTRLLNNQEAMVAENQIIKAKSEQYKIADSLNALKVSELNFTLAEYKRYKAQDAELINQLKGKESDLQKAIALQANTIRTLTAQLRDSVYKDTITGQTSPIKYFKYTSKWTDVTGQINKGQVSLQINNRESLRVIETVTYKRLFGFLWKTKQIKSRQINIVSENPNTEIVGCEYISVLP